MTMAGLTEFPDMFAAGVDLFGIVNFMTFFQAHRAMDGGHIHGGNTATPATQKEMLDRLSPIYKLDRIKAATMVQHGANDTNVPVIEAEQIAKTLRDRACRWNIFCSPTKATAAEIPIGFARRWRCEVF